MKYAWVIVLLLAAPAMADDGNYTRAQATQLLRNAKGGDAEAQYDLAMAYHDGAPGLAKNDSDAVQWFRKAAKQGEVRAQYNLAIAYYRGIGTKKDLAQAVKWFYAAANQGNADAQYALAAAYAKGVGRLPKDNAYAYLWLSRSKEGGLKDAARDLDSLIESMTPRELSRGKSLAAVPLGK